MQKYNPQKIEAKWQKFWETKQVFKAADNTKKPKKYVLVEFPYPSGAGLHMGHLRPYVAADVYSRYHRMRGFETLFPIGWDAFGLPAENYAIKMGVHPSITTKKNIANAKEQMQSWGLSFDWSREINTTDPDYYKWTQWLFLQFYKKGLAYEATGLINWCPKDKTGLANEEVIDGKCERCGTVVEKKELRQWYLKITDYGEKLLAGLKTLDKWPEPVKLQQENWIGKSTGAEIEFEINTQPVIPAKAGIQPQAKNYVLLHGFNGNSNGIFFPWIKKQLQNKGLVYVAPDLPNPENPTEDEQVDFVLKNCKFDENTVLFGHSLGAVVAMKVLEKLPHKIAGLVLAGGFTEPRFKDRKRPYDSKFVWKFDFKKIKNQAGEISILSDPNDFAIPLEQGKILAKNLDAHLIETPGQKSHFTNSEEPVILQALAPFIKVFTTRPDTLFGATYMVVAPEHEIIKNYELKIKNYDEVKKYIDKAAKKTEMDRTAEGKEKTGVELKGLKAVNPATKQEIPIWVADYVLGHYGTGAIMAVPAHDERDYEFAKKFNLPIKQVVTEYFEADDEEAKPWKEVPTSEIFNAACNIIKHPKEKKYLVVKHHRTKINGYFSVSGAIEPGEDLVEGAKREILEETGYKNLKFIKSLGDPVYFKFYKRSKNENRFVKFNPLYFELENEETVPIVEYERQKQEPVWLEEKDIEQFLSTRPFHRIFWNRLQGKADGCFSGYGFVINSEKFDGLETKEAIIKIGGEFGKLTTQYKLRDWVFSRQRYWGEPIPLIHCEDDGIVPVPDKDLPVELPKVKKYEPTGTGESPLADILKWVKTKCPKCGKTAWRETNTMPQWAGSSWYWLRYTDSKNKKKFADIKKQKYWTPVDVYFGGMEHTTLHLLYSRFWNLFLYDQGLVTEREPYVLRKPHGIVLGPDGEKMSKSRGNVVDPQVIVKKYGADVLRMYEMFLGPHEAMVAWNDKGIVGVARFLDRVWQWANEIIEAPHERAATLTPTLSQRERGGVKDADKVEKELNRLIKKVTEDIENFRFNTAISAFMEFHNAIKDEFITLESIKKFLIVLYPFAPHIAEELNSLLPNNKSGKTPLQTQAWPGFDESKILDAQTDIIVQINGRVRGKISLATGATQEQAQAEAIKLEFVKQALVNETVKRTIFVPNRLINLVI